jgi:hypothetical protein
MSIITTSALVSAILRPYHDRAFRSIHPMAIICGRRAHKQGSPRIPIGECKHGHKHVGPGVRGEETRVAGRRGGSVRGEKEKEEDDAGGGACEVILDGRRQ